MAVDAERKAGGLFAELERGKNQYDNGCSGNVAGAQSEYTATLESAGITMRDANRWQVEATIPEDEYLAIVGAVFVIMADTVVT
ncbi:MAG: hypothetical protein J5I90_16645 [Caldilineales bacterium]|nr:hypothetical protein [Caldilineales bacterium]